VLRLCAYLAHEPAIFGRDGTVGVHDSVRSVETDWRSGTGSSWPERQLELPRHPARLYHHRAPSTVNLRLFSILHYCSFLNLSA
jgi:hypothetical protein